MKMKWIILLIQFFLLSTVECGSHFLQFLSTGRVQPGDHPQFEQLTVFDGVPISYCDSRTEREELKPALESKNLPANCGEARYDILKSLDEFLQLINNTLSVVQRRRGCMLSADGIVSAFDAWAVNGIDFISFEPESQRWTSQSPSAETVKHRWNSKYARNFDWRHFIIQQCPLLIQGIRLRSRHQIIELRVFAKPIVNTDQALLRCHVTSTDVSVSSVHLIEDGASETIWITTTGPMPSEDGSVILRLTAWISLSPNTNTYGCRAQTGGHNFTVFWDGNTLDGRYLLDSVHWKILTGVLGFCCIVLVVTIISCGMICLLKLIKKKSRLGVSCRRGTETNGEWEQWVLEITYEEGNFYDPEYFAHKIDGALQ